MVKISFSWDDGAVEDIKLMELSIKYNIPGIFFIPAKNSERDVMCYEDIKTIAKNDFEIGAHTYSHSYLDLLNTVRATDEIIRGKLFLEQLLGYEIPHFCFPGGKFNPQLIEISKKHFKSVRTADTGSLIASNSFVIKPTFHFYNRSKKSLLYNSMKNRSILFKYALTNIASKSYFEFIKNIIIDLSNSEENNKIIIWGHSWEIEKYQLWDSLIDFFKFINENFPENKLNYTDLINS